MRSSIQEDINTTGQFETLRNIIVGKQDFVREEEYRQFQNEVLSKLDALESMIKDKDRFESQIVESKERVVDVVSPKMGKIIRTSINLQIEKINEKIRETSTQLSDLVNPKKIYQKMIGRKKIYYADYPKIIQLFVIERDSGLMIGKYEKEQLNDPDMMTGLLTSIKTFAESSLSIKDAEVGLIDYGDYFIKLFNYGTYYFALVFSGKQNTDFENFIYAEIDAFTTQYTDQLVSYDRVQDDLDKNLQLYFDETCEKLEKK